MISETPAATKAHDELETLRQVFSETPATAKVSARLKATNEGAGLSNVAIKRAATRNNLWH